MQHEIEFFNVPIAIRALKYASVYKLKNDKGTFLIDAGMGTEGTDFLEKAGVDFSSIDAILLTHLHIDHLGGGLVAGERYGIPLYIGKKDLDLINMIQGNLEKYADHDENVLRVNGVPDPSSFAFRKENPVFARMDDYEKLSLMDLDKISSDKTGIKTFYVPGHSPGSTCFIPEGTDKIFTGDHILEKITPNISYYDADSDLLGMYLQSLENTSVLNVDMAYPGHGAPFRNVKERIEGIILHHRHRMEEILHILADGKSTAFDVSRKMKWSRDRKLDSMNDMERKFAFGEAISHLRHMEATGMCSVNEKNGVMYYSK